MAQKYIIYDNTLIAGNVTFHSDLMAGRDNSLIRGGGWWHWDKERNEVTFYGLSSDYGMPFLTEVWATA
jgi:hypothetical protein